MEILGEIQNIRKDFKGIQINNEWYMFFKPNKNVKKGDYVNLEYKENKGFKNIKKIVLVEKTDRVDYTDKKEILDTTIKLDTTTFNTILMCAKDIKIEHLKNKVNIKYKDILNEVIEGLKELMLTNSGK